MVVLGALKKNSDDYRGACGVQVLHDGRDAGPTPVLDPDAYRVSEYTPL